MAQTFELERGRVFVAGLFWLPITGQASAKKQQEQVRQLASEQKTDLCILRTTGALQVGLGSSNDGLRPGMLSAAAIISKTLEIEKNGARDFICATEVPGNRWLFVSQRDGVLLPNGDMIGTEDTIRARLLKELSLGACETIIAPPHWSIPGATKERAFADFLPSKNNKIVYHRWWALQPVAPQRRKLIVPAALALALIIVCSITYKNWKAKQDADRAAAIAAANTPPPPPPPWRAMGKASDFVTECVAGIKNMETLWPGNWDLSGIDCANGQLTVKWKRGTYGALQQLTSIFGQDIEAVADGTEAKLIKPLKSLSSDDDQLGDEKTRMRELYEGAQKLALKFSIAGEQGEKKPLPGMQQPGAMPNQWTTKEWVISDTDVPPWVIAGVIDGPGMRLKSLKALINNGVFKWSMEGKLYVKP